MKMTDSIQKIFTERLNALVAQRLESKNGKRRINAAKTIADSLDRSPSAVRKWLSGSGLPETQPLVELCSFLECTPNFLLGIDESLGSQAKTSFALATLPQEQVPILGNRKSGWVCVGYSSIGPMFNLPARDGSYFFFRAPSDSMWPTIRINEMVLVRDDISAFEENEILLVYFDGNLAIRRLQRRFGTCAVMSDNKEHYPEVSVDIDKIVFLHELSPQQRPTAVASSSSASSILQHVRNGQPLLDALAQYKGVLIVVGQVTSAVRSFVQPHAGDEIGSSGN
jgi:SOS-response transcriptional repressor LexA